MCPPNELMDMPTPPQTVTDPLKQHMFRSNKKNLGSLYEVSIPTLTLLHVWGQSNCEKGSKTIKKLTQIYHTS